MPQGCKLFSPEIMHRDFFKCNPRNTGHYQYPKFETLSYDENCHRREVNKLLKRSEPDKYVIFYTRHTELKGMSSNKIIGYFKVGRECNNPRGFAASEAVLLPKDKCIKIDYSGRGVPVSWGNSRIGDEVDIILEERLIPLVNSPTNIKEKYKEETCKIMELINSSKLLSECENCTVQHQCYWGRKGNKAVVLTNLYGVNR